MKNTLIFTAVAFTALAAACSKAPAGSSTKADSSASDLPVIDFEADTQTVKGTLKAGQQAVLHYAKERVKCKTSGEGGMEDTQTTAYYILNDQEVTIGELATPGQGEPTMHDLTFTIPDHFTQLAIYVNSTVHFKFGGDCKIYDSNYSKNWLFPVQPN